MRRLLLTLTAVIGLATSLVTPAGAVTLVPPGNRHAEQPDIPGASSRRTKAGHTTFARKYQKVRELLANDSDLISKIKMTVRAYRIDPIHMVGAIVGEHTYNVDAYDSLQAY